MSDSKVRLALFPEMSMTGFTMKPECFYEDEKGRTYSVMAKLASKYNIYIGYGYISRKIADIITLMLLLIILENNMQL